MSNKKDAQAIDTSFTHYLRQRNKLSCPLEECNGTFPDTENGVRNHLQLHHPDLLELKNPDALVQEFRKGHITTSKQPEEHISPTHEGSMSPADPGGGGGLAESWATRNDGSVWSPNKRRKSPASSIKMGARSLSPPKRSRARQVPTSEDPDFQRRSPQQGKLWSPDNAGSPSSPRAKGHLSSRPVRSSASQKSRAEAEDEAASPQMITQPETRPISQEQLVAEVKGIYAGLVMVESKCIEVDNAQSSQSDTKLNHEQWQALIALHRTLLHEHHDFFLASQHPSASQALRRLASKYAMPARMWRHGIHSFLELLRHRLPGSLEHMLTFIYLAYSMMALLYETVPAFEDTWIECLGDLGRYRMAIEDDDIRDRENWTSVSRHWYSKASDKAPTTGRLYHHLAILARPNALQQLFYYTKSLCVPIPFGSARESIMTLFDPILNAYGNQNSRLMPAEVAFVKAHGILFSGKMSEEFDHTVDEFLGMLDDHIGRTTRRWMESGYFIAVANCCSLLSYGKDDNPIMKLMSPRPDELAQSAQNSTTTEENSKPRQNRERALQLNESTNEVVFHRLGDHNVYPFWHVVLVFIYHLTYFRNAMDVIEATFPWKLVSLSLNSLLLSYREHERIRSDAFPREGQEIPPRPLPEDFAMRGLLWVDKYYPQDWFSNDKIDDDEKYFEAASMTDERKERLLWLGCRIAERGKWLTYDQELHQFGVTSDYEKEIDAISKDADMMNISEAADSSVSATASDKATGQDDDTMDVDELPSAPYILQ